LPILLTYGDSNTYGTPPIITRGSPARFDSATRWPPLCAKALGADWHLVEEGLPGRTTCFDDPIMIGRNGIVGLRMALASHGPVDVLTLMLGTNDVKSRFGNTADDIVAGLAMLTDMALGPEMTPLHPKLKVLLICPPPVVETGSLAAEFIGAAAKSKALAKVASAYAKARNIGFLDAGSVLEVSPTDGIHFEPEGHKALGAAVAKAITSL
jgi:lysophospholipase L1-like esterase